MMILKVKAGSVLLLFIAAAALVSTTAAADARAGGRSVAETSAEASASQEAALYDRIMYCISRGEYREGLELCALLTEAFPESPRLADVSYWTGDLLASVAAGEPAGQLKAISAYEEAMAIFPSHPFAEATAFRVGELYYGLGFTYETVETFNRFLEKFPESELVPEARRMRARCMYGAGRYEDAEAEFRSYLEDYPDSPYRPEITLGLADTFFHLGKMSASRVLYEEVEQRWPHVLRSSAGSLYQMGEIYFQRMQYGRARDQFLTLTNVHSTYEHVAKGYLRIGESLLQEGKIGPALLFFDRVASRSPDSEEAFTGVMYMADIGKRYAVPSLGLLLEFPENCRRPEDTYRRLLEENPYHPLAATVASKLGSALLDAGDSAGVVHALERFVESSEEPVRGKLRELTAEGLFRIILEAQSRGDLDTVLLAYETHRDFLDEVMGEDVMLAVGSALRTVGLREREGALYERMLARGTGSTPEEVVIPLLAECYRDLGDIPGLERLVETATSRCPEGSTHATVLYALAQAHDSARRREEQVDACLEALGRGPSHAQAPEGYYRLGNALAAQGFAADAARSYQRAVESFTLLHPDEEAPEHIIRCYFLTSDAFYSAGLYDEAINWYRRSLHLFPNHPAKARALYFMAAAYHHLGQPDRAAEVVAELRALERSPDAAIWIKVAAMIKHDPTEDERVRQMIAEARGDI